MNAYVIPFEQLGMRDVETVGGKNASLGEMIGALDAASACRCRAASPPPPQAYREFLQQGGLDERIRAELASLDVDDVDDARRDRRAHPPVDPGDTVPAAAASRP